MKEFTEKNILLAKFLGYVDNGCSEDGFLIDPNTNYDIEIENLKFHTSWDWLMLVVGEIESLPMTIVLIGSKLVIINTHDKYENDLKTFKEDVSKTKIEAVYNACVEFVKWYNSQN